MSTQRLLAKRRKGMGRSLVASLSLLAGLLLACQLAFPSLALALRAGSPPTHSATAVPAPSPSTVPTAIPSTGAVATATPLAVPQDMAQALAQVAVVRLVTSYSTEGSSAVGGTGVTVCTGLGVLVGSWSSAPGSATLTNWVLTDSTVISPKGCTSASTAKLVSVRVLANDVYTSTPAASSPPSSATLVSVTCATNPLACQVLQLNSPITPVPCTSQTTCGGAVLFVFASPTTRPQPFVALATAGSAPHVGIQLLDNAGQLPASSRNSIPDHFLNPTLFSATDSALTASALAPSEVGMPIFTTVGKLVAMHLSSGTLDLGKLSTFLNSQTGPTSHNNALNTAWMSGIADFYARPPKYQAAQTQFMAALAANSDFQAAGFMLNAAMQASKTPTPTPATPPSPEVLGIPLWVLTIIGLVVLLAIFLLVSLNFGRRRAQQRQELARFRADQRAAQQLAEREIERQQQASAPGNRAGLSPSAPGMNMYATPPAQPAQPTSDASWSGNYPPPPLQMSPQQAAYPQQPPSLMPASSISDQPTIEMPHDRSRNGQPDAEKTVPYAVQQVRGRNLSLAVGSRSDPGIKRKHKPNEDNLFAMQGARTQNAQPQQFGLFVVADGMGGHASGQDASRLAIQTIIDYILPKVSGSDNMDDAAFLKLLADGVQRANEAVHKRNMEERADMGTTMTTTLVVGSTAYVANVGDSRTYLYREPEGLQKITRDHSVVASLVDAGIIQPDDIYTHPKRNQIYRSLGEKPVVEVDSFQVPLQPGDKLLLCSDGLWDMVRDPEIQRIMSTPAPDPAQTGEALIQAALQGGGEDNVSVIVVYITEASNRTGITGIQLLAKPDSVTVPEMPAM